MERFVCKTEILSGVEAGEALKAMGIVRLMLVCDPFFAQNGTAARIAACAQAQAVQVYDRVQPDPTVELVAQGTAALREFAPDTVAALGGGSAMDCAKAMAYFSGLAPRLIAIPTTSGSGSEVTDFAVLTHGGTKYPLVDDALRPQAALLDEALLGEQPPRLVADSGFDLICHALESRVAAGAGAVSNALAEQAFCTAMELLPRSYRGDRAARMAVHRAATMAGMAFSSAGLGLCHAIAHSLGGAFHVSHGRLNAVLLPCVLTHNAAAAGREYAALARRAGLSGGADSVAVRALKNALLRLRRELELPQDLAQAGIDPERLRQEMQRLIDAALADPCCASNPVAPNAAMIRKILSEVAGG